MSFNRGKKSISGSPGGEPVLVGYSVSDLDVKEAVESPQGQARGMIVELDHEKAGKIKMAGSPIKASLTPLCAQSAPPLLGQDTESTHSEWGYNPEEIEVFKAEGDI